MSAQTQAPPELVRLDELAGLVGSIDAARHWIAESRTEVFTDWSGREVVTSAAALRAFLAAGFTPIGGEVLFLKTTFRRIRAESPRTSRARLNPPEPGNTLEP